MAFGAALNGFHDGYHGIAGSILGLALPVAVLLLPFALGVSAAGTSR
jgi:hypothetical protein